MPGESTLEVAKLNQIEKYDKLLINQIKKTNIKESDQDCRNFKWPAHTVIRDVKMISRGNEKRPMANPTPNDDKTEVTEVEKEELLQESHYY